MPKQILHVAAMALCVIANVSSFNMSKASPQVTQAREAELRKKYTWGSIYLTYGNICDITQILSNPREAGKISSKSSAVIPVLINFLKRHAADNQRDGVAFLEINLNNQEAGFMKASDLNGVINRIPWSSSQVMQIGDLFDLFLIDYSQFLASYLANINQDIRLEDAWISVLNAHKMVFVPRDKLTFLHIAFRVLVESKNSELAQMKFSHPSMFSQIEKFKAKFDIVFATLVSPTDREQYIPRLVLLNGTLQKEVLAPRTNLYTDPDKTRLLERGSVFSREGFS